MILTIDTENPQAKALVEYLRTLEFVRLQEDPNDIPDWHKIIVRESAAEYHKDNSIGENWKDVLKEIEQKLNSQNNSN